MIDLARFEKTLSGLRCRPRVHRPKRRGQLGIAFIALIATVGALAVFLAYAVQPWSVVLQRDREEELIFRGEQITEAIRAYQVDHGGAYPPDLEELLKPGQNKVPYLRRPFTNPFDFEDGKWGLLTPGQTIMRQKEDGGTEFVDPKDAGLGDFGSQQGNMNRPPTLPQTAQPTGQRPGCNMSGRLPGQQGQGQGQLPPGMGMVLPFKVGGEEGQPILGVYAPVEIDAFKTYYGKSNINEWFFSPLVIQPPGQQGQLGGPQQPNQPNQPGQGGQQGGNPPNKP